MKAQIIRKLIQATKYKKVGGLHFLRLGRLGFSFYLAQSKLQKQKVEAQSALR